MTTTSKTSKKPVYAGLSITRRIAELVIYSPKNGAVEQSISLPIPDGVLDLEGDSVRNAAELRTIITHLLKGVKPKPSAVHLSLPGTLLRMVEMPKIDDAGLYLSLSSEAERYKMFDNTEAIVDFFPVEKASSAANRQQLVFGALRNDSLNTYLKILKDLKVKVASVGMEPLNVLRALAGTGVLDGMVQQIGPDSYWGLILVEPLRVRFSVWQCNRLIDLRETAIETANFSQAGADSILLEDMVEEIRRTTKNIQPSLWLTHEMPSGMMDLLTERFSIPFRPAPIGNIQLSQPVELSGLGCALSSIVNFPADFDLLAGLNVNGKAPANATTETTASSNSSSDTGMGDKLIPIGGVLLALSVIATGILFFMATTTASKVAGLTSTRDGKQMEVSALTQRENELKRKAALDKTLLTLINEARIRNQIFVNITDDLQRKIPTNVWLSTMEVNDSMHVTGKGLNHSSIIHFAQSFDDAPYTRAVLIDSIQEGKMNNKLVYDFRISGGIQLNPSLLKNDLTASPTNGETPPSTKPGA